MASQHDITLVNAAAKTLNFQNSYPNALKGGKIPKDEIIEILLQSGCVGLRYYFALDNTANPNAIHVVLVGVDQNGNDIVPSAPGQPANPAAKLKDGAWGCPPNCSTANDLNHL
ncbi:MAG TPA: hypothetical protein PLD84_05425 [Chitinophagales bacterium]|nr:hypothetical protein [Chitinophagales bacterium]